MKAECVAASPVYAGTNGKAAYRIVLREKENRSGWFTHKQYFYDDGSSSFASGNYFTVRPSDDPKDVFQEALKDFVDRTLTGGQYDELAPPNRAEPGIIHTQVSPS